MDDMIILVLIDLWDGMWNLFIILYRILSLLKNFCMICFIVAFMYLQQII